MPLSIDHCLEQLYRGDILSEVLVKEICDRLRDLLIYESNLAHVPSPVTIVGNLNGQFFDLLELFRVGGRPPDTNYLFLGGYVDRGYYSVETISLLVCLKLRFPDRITLLRGTDESRSSTQVYGFYGECLRKYGNANVWRYFTDMFDYLTLAALVDDRIYCVHGGLSPSVVTLDQLRVLDRFHDVPTEGAVAELLWADPDSEREGFHRARRGGGYSFGHDTVTQFLQVNHLDHIVRTHQLCIEGYTVLFNGKLSSIWSAPNFCYRCGNVAAILEVNEKLERLFNTYAAAPDSQQPTTDMQKPFPDYFETHKADP